MSFSKRAGTQSNVGVQEDTKEMKGGKSKKKKKLVDKALEVIMFS